MLCLSGFEIYSRWVPLKSVEEFVSCKAHKHEHKPEIVYNPVSRLTCALQKKCWRRSQQSLFSTYHQIFPELAQPLRNEFPEFWELLGIPRNPNLFQDMQMRKGKKPWNIW